MLLSELIETLQELQSRVGQDLDVVLLDELSECAEDELCVVDFGIMVNASEDGEPQEIILVPEEAEDPENEITYS